MIIPRVDDGAHWRVRVFCTPHQRETQERHPPVSPLLNPHLRALALQGVFIETPEGAPLFEQFLEPTSIDVAELLAVSRVRVLRPLTARGVIEAPDDSRPVSLLVVHANAGKDLRDTLLDPRDSGL